MPLPPSPESCGIINSFPGSFSLFACPRGATTHPSLSEELRARRRPLPRALDLLHFYLSHPTPPCARKRSITKPPYLIGTLLLSSYLVNLSIPSYHTTTSAFYAHLSQGYHPYLFVTLCDLLSHHSRVRIELSTTCQSLLCRDTRLSRAKPPSWLRYVPSQRETAVGV